MKNVYNGKVFGYNFSDILRAQQGGRLNKVVDRSPEAEQKYKENRKKEIESDMAKFQIGVDKETAERYSITIPDNYTFDPRFNGYRSINKIMNDEALKNK